jgi:hypothetical protein
MHEFGAPEGLAVISPVWLFLASERGTNER